MITKIIACADIHIPSLRKIDDTKYILEKFISKCKEIVEENGVDETRIVIAGDIFDNKLNITNESIIAVDWLFNELNNICKTIVLAGNHDLLMSNLDRMDSLTPLFEIGKYSNIIYIDKELGYKSGYLEDSNVVWCLYSTFDNFSSPCIAEIKALHPRKKLIGLIHTDINGAITSTNRVTEDGIDASTFEGLKFVIAGHIHKHQEIRQKGVPVVYCSSVKQKEMGESITGHGFVLWDVKSASYDFIPIENDKSGFFKFSIDSIDDLNEDKEELINL